MKFLRKLFGICDHDYVNEHTYERCRNVDNKVIGFRFVDKCTKCGHRKVTDV